MSDLFKLNIKTKNINVKLKNNISIGEQAESPEQYFQKQVENSFQTGYEEGYSRAKNDLEEGYQEELLNRFNTFQNILSNLNTEMIEYEKSYETIVYDLAFEIASKILKREIEKENIIADVLSQSLKKVVGANNVIIKINPLDYEWLNDMNLSLFKDDTLNRVKFEMESKIERGGCMVETELGNIDAKISSQLNEIRKYFDADLNSDE